MIHCIILIINIITTSTMHCSLSVSTTPSVFTGSRFLCLFLCLISGHLHVFLQRPPLRKVFCFGARGRLPPTGTSTCRTSTSGGPTATLCGRRRNDRLILFSFLFFPFFICLYTSFSFSKSGFKFPACSAIFLLLYFYSS